MYIQLLIAPFKIQEFRQVRHSSLAPSLVVLLTHENKGLYYRMDVRTKNLGMYLT